MSAKCFRPNVCVNCSGVDEMFMVPSAYPVITKRNSCVSTCSPARDELQLAFKLQVTPLFKKHYHYNYNHSLVWAHSYSCFVNLNRIQRRQMIGVNGFKYLISFIL